MERFDQTDLKHLKDLKYVDAIRPIDYWLLFIKEQLVDLRKDRMKRALPITVGATLVAGLTFLLVVGYIAEPVLKWLLGFVCLLGVPLVTYTIFHEKASKLPDPLSFQLLAHFLAGLKNEVIGQKARVKMWAGLIKSSDCKLKQQDYPAALRAAANKGITIYEQKRAEAVFRYEDGSKGSLRITERLIEKRKVRYGSTSGKRKVKYKYKTRFFIDLDLLLSNTTFSVDPDALGALSFPTGVRVQTKVKELKKKQAVLIKVLMKNPMNEHDQWSNFLNELIDTLFQQQVLSRKFETLA